MLSLCIDKLTSYLDCWKFVLGNEEKVRFEEVVGGEVDATDFSGLYLLSRKHHESISRFVYAALFISLQLRCWIQEESLLCCYRSYKGFFCVQAGGYKVWMLDQDCFCENQSLRSFATD